MTIWSRALPDRTPLTATRLAVLVSGSGSNLQALIDADLPQPIRLVLSNKPGVRALERAEKAGIASIVLPHQAYATREQYDAALHAKLVHHKIDFICLAGFMRLLTPGFTQLWHNKMVNIHPSLLPSFKGHQAIDDALVAGVKITGCTVHLVRAAMDSGPILGQAAIPVRGDDTASSLAARMHAAEHRLYPSIMQAICRGQVAMNGEIPIIAAPDIDQSPSMLVNPA